MEGFRYELKSNRKFSFQIQQFCEKVNFKRSYLKSCVCIFGITLILVLIDLTSLYIFTFYYDMTFERNVMLLMIFLQFQLAFTFYKAYFMCNLVLSRFVVLRKNLG